MAGIADGDSPRLATASLDTIRQTVSATGTIEPAQQTNLNFDVGSQVTAILGVFAVALFVEQTTGINPHGQLERLRPLHRQRLRFVVRPRFRAPLVTVVDGTRRVLACRSTA
jgi:hypothetical protein